VVGLVVSVINLVEPGRGIPLVRQRRAVVDKHIGGIGTADSSGILVRNGDGLLLKVGHGGVKIEEYIEISLQCRLKRNGTMTPEVDDLTRKAARVLRNRSNRHRMKLVLKICKPVA
jgi:hypothetical protein